MSSAQVKRLKVGEPMPDGTLFAGISPNTQAPFYVRPVDEPYPMKQHEGAAYAKEFSGKGELKRGFRLATEAEFKVLFNNKAKIGCFDTTEQTGWYWTQEERRISNIGRLVSMHGKEQKAFSMLKVTRGLIRLVHD